MPMSVGESRFSLCRSFPRGSSGDLFARERQLCVVALLPVPVLFDDVAAVDDRGDRRGVGRRTADAQLFEAFDERGLVIARRSRGEALRGGDLRREAVSFGSSPSPLSAAWSSSVDSE